MRVPLLAVLLASAVAVGAADPPAIVEVPRQPAPKLNAINTSVGKQLILTAGPTTKEWWLAGESLPADLTFAATTPQTATFTASKAGRYYVAASTADGHLSRTVIVVDGAPLPPDPDPPVPPGPHPPEPQPAGDPSYFVVLEDTSKAGAWRGDVLADPKVAAFYRALRGSRTGPIHRLVDVNGDKSDPISQWAVQTGAGKPLPWLWVMAADGTILKSVQCPTTADAFVAVFDLHAGDRKLGLIPGKPKLQWPVYGSDANTPIIPRAQWRPMSLAAYLNPIRDQDGRGQCASSAACNLVETCRNVAGLPPVTLSAGDLYSRVNGGRDSGSMLEDNLLELQQNGVCTTSLVPYVWNGRRNTSPAVVAERQQYRVVQVYLCRDFDAVASAIQMGFVVEVGIDWYDSYTPDRDGWLPAPRGGVGGHALMSYGLTQRGGKWGLSTRNQWGAAWGGSADGSIGPGDCVIPESAFGNDIGGFWAVRSVTSGPNVTPLPTPKAERLDIRRGEFALAF